MISMSSLLLHEICSPLQIVRSGVLVLTFWAERTHISWRIVDQTMPNHLVLAFKPLSSLATGTSRHWTVVGPR
jgi:hypothetical protein